MLDDLAAERTRLSDLLDEALSYSGKQVKQFAEAERAYREAKDMAMVTAKVELPKATVSERNARVDAATADLRKARDIADGMRQVGIEAIRSRRQQLSAWQTLTNIYVEEAKFARTGPE